MTFQRPTMTEDWERLASIVFSEDAPPEQFRTIKLAFYAGAWAILCHVDAVNGFPDKPMIEVAQQEYIKELKRDVRRILDSTLRKGERP